jgi:hypothetical protein
MTSNSNIVRKVKIRESHWLRAGSISITCPENRNAARLPRSRFFSAAILIVDSQILPAIKRTEALKIHKYLHPDYFFMGSHRSTMFSNIVDLSPEQPRSTMFSWGNISVYRPPWWAPFL